MKSNRVWGICQLFFFVCGALAVDQAAAKNSRTLPGSYCFGEFGAEGQEESSVSDVLKKPFGDDRGGIREEIPDKYRARYERWKSEFLSTKFGREQWSKYAESENFLLVVKISEDTGQGAGTSGYEWNERGELVGATIVLGPKIDKGYPNPIYFPVVNSLSIKRTTYRINENILAAAKLAHEFGHVNQTAKTGGETFRRQNELIDRYNEVFRAGNYGLKDTRLAELQKELGGTPVEIWENREYWGETNAMYYLVERIGKEEIYCSFIDKIENNVKSFAARYEDRFMPVIQSSHGCGN